jgi:hypothetical protein
MSTRPSGESTSPIRPSRISSRAYLDVPSPIATNEGPTVNATSRGLRLSPPLSSNEGERLVAVMLHELSRVAFDIEPQ